MCDLCRNHPIKFWLFWLEAIDYKEFEFEFYYTHLKYSYHHWLHAGDSFNQGLIACFSTSSISKVQLSVSIWLIYRSALIDCVCEWSRFMPEYFMQWYIVLLFAHNQKFSCEVGINDTLFSSQYIFNNMPVAANNVLMYTHWLVLTHWPLGDRAVILTHWGWVTHICVSKIIIIGSDNGLSPGRRQAIIWANPGILLIGPLGINFSEILIEINTFSFNKMHLKMSSPKWRLFHLGLNVLNEWFSNSYEG